MSFTSLHPPGGSMSATLGNSLDRSPRDDKGAHPHGGGGGGTALLRVWPCCSVGRDFWESGQGGRKLPCSLPHRRIKLHTPEGRGEGGGVPHHGTGHVQELLQTLRCKHERQLVCATFFEGTCDTAVPAVTFQCETVGCTRWPSRE